jgi:hypothetical protein
MLRCTLTLLVISLIHSLAAGQPAAPTTPATPTDAWRTAPYRLTLVLHVDPHPLLTKDFVEDLRDEVRDALQRDLGSLCNVEVIDDDPLMKEILTRGWSVLDNRRFTVDEQKRHFLRVTYDGGQYAIQARQVDGSTALVSPLRKVHTPDRLWVSRLVALTVAQDFGMVAQIGRVDIKTVQLFLKGTGLKDPASIRVQTGEVFALAEVRQGAEGKAQGLPIPDAYLVVSDVRPNGECTTRLFTRYKDPIKAKPDRASLGYRAIKLGTQRAPLQLRVVDAITKEPLPGCGVKVYPSGFDSLQTEELTTNAQGRVRTKDTYKNVVFVKLYLAGLPKADVPFPLLSDQPVEYPLTGSDEADARARLDYRDRQWLRQARELGLELDLAAARVREAESKSGEQAGAALAKQVVAKAKQDLDQLRKDQEEVRDAGRGASQQALDSQMARAQKALKDLDAKIQVFVEYAEIIDNPTPARIALKKAKFEDRAFNAVEAIAAYKLSLKEDPNQPEVKDRLEKIEKAWALKGDAHAKARKFAFETWGKLEGDELAKGLAEARNVSKICQQHSDFFTGYKLFKENAEHLQRLTAQRDQLANSKDEDAQDRIDAINKLGEEIQKFNEEVATWIDKAAA